MPSRFKDRLERLHGSRAKLRDIDEASDQPRVFLADDIDEQAIAAAAGDGGQPAIGPDARRARWTSRGAEALDTPLGPACRMRREHPQTYRHGRVRLVEATAVALGSVGDGCLGGCSEDAIAYVDLETTGLGKQDFAFCIGLGRWVGRAFVVDQYVMACADDEPAVLGAVAQALADCTGLCTFNGQSFDVPMLRRRFDHHQIAHPLDELAHLDQLVAARGRWPKRASHKLQALERDLLGLKRVDDVPGRLVPRRWRDYLADADPGPVLEVLEHNRLDILTMVALLPALCQGVTRRPSQRETARPNTGVKTRSKTRRQTTSAGSAPDGSVKSKLARRYKLRDGTQSQRADPGEAAMPERVALGGTLSRSKLREAMPVGQRLRALRQEVERSESAGEADEAVLGRLLEMVALSPRHPFALERLVDVYRRVGQPELAEHFARRLDEACPF